MVRSQQGRHSLVSACFLILGVICPALHAKLQHNLKQIWKNISNIQPENKSMGVCELLSTLFEVF